VALGVHLLLVERETAIGRPAENVKPHIMHARWLVQNQNLKKSIIRYFPRKRMGRRGACASEQMRQKTSVADKARRPKSNEFVLEN